MTSSPCLMIAIIMVMVVLTVQWGRHYQLGRLSPGARAAIARDMSAGMDLDTQLALKWAVVGRFVFKCGAEAPSNKIVNGARYHPVNVTV